VPPPTRKHGSGRKRGQNRSAATIAYESKRSPISNAKNAAGRVVAAASVIDDPFFLVPFFSSPVALIRPADPRDAASAIF